MTVTQILCLCCFVFLIIGYFLQKIPMGITAMGTVALLMLTGCLTAKDALAQFGTANVMVTLFMFIVATGLSRTQMANNISNLVYKVSGGSFVKCMAGYMLLGIMMACTGSSGLANFTICYPFVVATCEKFNYEPSKGVYPLVMVTITAGGVIPLGNSLVAYIKNNGFLESFGFDPARYAFKILDPSMPKWIPTIVTLAYALYCAAKIAPEKCPVPPEGIKAGKQKKEKEPLPKNKEMLGYGFFLMTLVGLMTTGLTGLQPWQVAFFGACGIMLTGVLTREEIIGCLPVKPVSMYIGAMCMGTALVNTGTGEILGNIMVKALGGTKNPYIITTFFFLVPFILTQFMSNSSAQNILRPLILMCAMSMGCSPLGPFSCNHFATGLGFLTPMANVAIPVAMAAGGYDQKTILKMGLPLALLLCVVYIIEIPLFFPLWV